MAFRSSALTTFTGTTTLTANAPAGVATNDRLYAIISMDSSSGTISSVPSGWTELGSGIAIGGGADTQTIRLYENKQAGASPSYAWVQSVADDAVIIVAALTGRDNSAAATFSTGTGWSAAGTTSPISLTANSGTAVANDDALFFSAVSGGAADPWTWSAWIASFVEREDGGANWAYGALASWDAVSAGAMGTLTATVTRTSGTSVAGVASWVVAVPAGATAGNLAWITA
jgi:hypothetical protein